MATYTWQQAIDFTSKFVKGVPTTTLDAIAADTVNSIIWKYWFWKWSMKSLTAIAWVDGTQDYTIANTDFYRLYRARFTRTDVTPNIVREKTVVSFLSPNLEQRGGIDTIQAVTYVYESGKVRLDKAASVPTGTLVQIDGDFQFLPVKITAAATAIVFPEYYFDVAIEGLKWKYYQLIGDSKAGSIQIDKRQNRAYTGQLGIFHDALNAMAEAEGMGQGDSQRFPDDGFGAGRSANPGLFAWS